MYNTGYVDELDKIETLPTSSEYPEPEWPENPDVVYIVGSDVKANHAQESCQPPDYETSIRQRNTRPLKSKKKREYKYHDGNRWERFHEWFEKSIPRQILWLLALAFSIAYTFYGQRYQWPCFVTGYQFDEEGNLTFFEAILPRKVSIGIEGGLKCTFILIVFLYRLSVHWDRCRTYRQSLCMKFMKPCCAFWLIPQTGLFYLLFFVVNTCSILDLHFKERNTSAINKTMNCHPDLYNFYSHAKIVELTVMILYITYILIWIFVALSIYMKWFHRRKWRQWARLLDADQDGVISSDDMEKTNAKILQIRKLIKTETMFSTKDEQKWWNDHIFKNGPGKDISVNDYITYLEEIGFYAETISGFFNLFSPESYWKRITIREEDFVTFWTILADIDVNRSRKTFVNYIPTQFTMDLFKEDFVSFLSGDDRKNRIFRILRNGSSDTCRCYRV